MGKQRFFQSSVFAKWFCHILCLWTCTELSLPQSLVSWTQACCKIWYNWHLIRGSSLVKYACKTIYHIFNSWWTCIYLYIQRGFEGRKSDHLYPLWGKQNLFSPQKNNGDQMLSLLNLCLWTILLAYFPQYILHILGGIGKFTIIAMDIQSK